VAAVPGQGLGYGILRRLYQPTARILARQPGPEVLLAYLGDQTLPANVADDALFEPASDIAVAARDTGLGLGYAVEVRCWFQDGRLFIDWCHDPGRAGTGTITALAAALSTALADLTSGRRHAPADPGFPLAGLCGDELADLMAELEETDRTYREGNAS
jgi:phthiocerol/phenolphthiocerol synthesis type-I polyketide synthase E